MGRGAMGSVLTCPTPKWSGGAYQELAAKGGAMGDWPAAPSPHWCEGGYQGHGWLKGGAAI